MKTSRRGASKEQDAAKGRKVKLANLQPGKDPKGGQKPVQTQTDTKTAEVTRCCWG